MGDLSSNFNRKEFACKCGCGKDAVDYYLIQILEDIRKHFDVPIRITSGNRCKKYNAQIGGAKNSQHLHCKAADFIVQGVPAQDVQRYIDSWYPVELGVGYGKTFTHVDVRDGKARWSY